VGGLWLGLFRHDLHLSTGRNQLCTRPVAEVLFESIEFRQAALRWHVRLALLMPDHLHMLVSFPLQEALPRVVANFKECTAKRVALEWQRDFFDHRLRGDESLDEKASYIRMNPVRARLVACAELWPWVWTPASAAG